MKRKVIIGSRYKHFKGHVYEVLCIGKDSETCKDLVVYKNIDTDEIWIRDLDMFNSLVDKKKYPSAVQKYRFEIYND